MERCATWQGHRDLGESTDAAIDGNSSTMLSDNDVVAEREAEASALAGWLCGEERFKHVRLDLLGNTYAIVPDTDGDVIWTCLGGDAQGRLEIRIVSLCFPARCRVKAVGNEVEHDARKFLRVKLERTGGRIVMTDQNDVEPWLLRPRAMIGEVQRFFDGGVE